MSNLRYPNISGLTEKEQLVQIKSYLHQLVEQLNYTLSTIGVVDGEVQTESNSSYNAYGGDMSYYELRSMIVQELQHLNTQFIQLSERLYEDVDEVAKLAAEKISFTLDEDGNLYYEVEE